MAQIFAQKKNGNELRFQIDEHELVYTAKLGSTKYTRTFSYNAISSKTSEFVEKNEWFRNAGILWIVIGVFQFALTTSLFSFWFMVGVVSLAIYYFRQTKFTVIEADEKNILIIADKNHDLIFDSIMENRKHFIKKMYGEINFDNAPENEIRKFEYLLKEKIVSTEEFKEIQDNIESHHKNKPIPSPISFI